MSREPILHTDFQRDDEDHNLRPHRICGTLDATEHGI